MRTRMMVAAASMVGLLVVIGALPAASAIAPEPNAATMGDCTGGTRARLTLSRDDGHIEAEDRAPHREGRAIVAGASSRPKASGSLRW